MKNLNLHRDGQCGITTLSNAFIDQYMVHANGEYVKVYIYLLRCMSSNEIRLTLSGLADVFDYTEKDIRRALKYWAKKDLLRLEFNDQKELTDIHLLDLPSAKPKTEAVSVRTEEKPNLQLAETAAASSPSPDHLKKIQEKDDIKQLFFIAEQYMGKTLSSTDVNTILYFYDELHFSTDLIEYLIEYCVSKGVRSMHYMKTVALAWTESSITTVADAKESTNLYHKNCFAIMNAFGIKGRNPAPADLEYINKWINEYNFTLDILLEACNRTIQTINKPSFKYADSILDSWKKNGVKHLTDIQLLDARHKKQEAGKAQAKEPVKTPSSANRFNNFHQRDYDFDKLEKSLLNSK